MNWTDRLELNRNRVIGGTILVCFATLLVTVLRNPIAYDSFWHLQMGRDWIVNGLSPWRDHYSFTFPGAEIVSPPYLFQALLHWLVSWFGLESGFRAYKLASMTLVFGAVIFHLRNVRAPVIVYCLVLPLLVLLLELRAQVRPELFSYTLSIIALLLYRRAVGELTMVAMLPVVLLMCFWSNYHTPIIGYVIFFGMFIDSALRLYSNEAPSEQWLKWLGWGVLVVAVGFLNPSFTHAIQTLWTFQAEWKLLIQEYTSPAIYKEIAGIYVLVMVTLASLVLAWKQRRFGYLFVCLFLASNAATMARLVTPAGIVILCIFADLAGHEDWSGFLNRHSAASRKFLQGIVILGILIPLVSAVNVARAYMKDNPDLLGRYPEALVDYMIEQGKAGRIFNEYPLGGYLIHHLSPASQVYIDGRTGILYPLEHFKKWKAAKADPAVLESETDAFGIDFLIFSNTPQSELLAAEAGGFGLDFVDSKYLLFSRDKPAFPVSGNLHVRPACWTPLMRDDIETEERAAKAILPAGTPFRAFLDFASAYSSAADETLFLENLSGRKAWTDASLRFAGYRALDLGLYPIAFELFAGVAAKQAKDYLAGAQAMLKAGDLNRAERVLDEATRISWPRLELVDLAILYQLLEELKRLRPLEVMEDGVAEGLATELESAGIAARMRRLNSELYCALPGWEDS